MATNWGGFPSHWEKIFVYNHFAFCRAHITGSCQMVDLAEQIYIHHLMYLPLVMLVSDGYSLYSM